MEKALELARSDGCYQLRSRIWYTRSVANMQSNLSMRAVVQPSLEDDSGYFIISL